MEKREKLTQIKGRISALEKRGKLYKQFLFLYFLEFSVFSDETNFSKKKYFFFFPIFINFLPMIFIGKKICENIRDIRKLNFPCCYFSLGCVGSYVIYV
jgi:hypothetical protein